MNIGPFEKEVYEMPHGFPEEWITQPVPQKELEPAR